MTCEKKKFQIQRRVKKLTVPCDKLSTHMFQFSADEYKEIIENREECCCVEGIKKDKKIKTPYWLELIENYQDLLPLNAFHREILFHAMNFYEQGFNVVTISMTLDSLTQYEKRHICKAQYDAIKQAIDKLGFTRITIDLAPLFKAYPKYAANFKGKRDRAELVGTLLPMKYLETEINGQKTLAIELLGESPLMTVAKLKKQILTYDATPLAIAEQNNTPTVMTIKNYLLRRIELMKSSKRRKGLSPIILFETLYKQCGLADATKWQKQDARKEIELTLNSFKADGVIKNFEFEKADRAYRDIKITLQ